MIQEVKLRLFSDPELTHMEAEFTASGTTSPQTIPMSGLDSATRYYAVAYATDDNGVTGESQTVSFRTLEAAVTVEGHVDYGITYDVLKYNVDYYDAEAYTFVAKGVEFSTQMDFHSDVQTFVYPAGATGWQNASPFDEHTLYYYRFFAEFEEIGRVYGQPEQNTITTRYAMPVFTITTNEVGENDAQITISYTGDYPIDYNSLQGSVVGGTGSVFSLQLDALTPTHPETITLSGLDASTLYEVEVWMRYYDTYAEAYSSFTTAESTVHNYDIRFSPTWNVDYHIIDFDVTATKIAFGRFTVTNIGIDICAVPDFSGHQLGGELGSGSLTFTWEATGLNEHRRYYCRPWIETLEYGREYGETKIVESHWDVPEIVIEQSDEGWDSVLLNVKYAGGLTVPANGLIKIYSADMQTLVRTISASDLVWNGSKQILVTGLQTHTTYKAVYEGAYYSFGNLVTATAEINTSAQRMVITRTDSWAQNGQHTDVVTVNIGLGDSIENANFLYPLGITIVSQTVQDNVYTIVTDGYRYGNPYQLSADITLEDDYNQSETFGITVPAQDLRVYASDGIRGYETALPDTIRAELHGDFYNVTASVLFEKTGGGSTEFSLSETVMDDTKTYLDFFYDCLQQGNYTVTYTITNVFGQTATQRWQYVYIVPYGVIIPNQDENGIYVKLGWNRSYTPPDETTAWLSLAPGIKRLVTKTITSQSVPATDTTAAKLQWEGYITDSYVDGVDYIIGFKINNSTSMTSPFTTTGVTPLNLSVPTGVTSDIDLTRIGNPAALNIEYSLNGGQWQTWAETNNVRSVHLESRDTVYIRNTSDTSTQFSLSGTDRYTFSSTGNYNSNGDVRSLLCKNPENAVLTQHCFRSLFFNSGNLLSMPELKSTTGAKYCYMYMFYGTAITQTTEIKLVNVSGNACNGMFKNCNNLNMVTVRFETTFSSSLTGWLDNVASVGTLKCPQSLVLPSGPNGLPSGWSRVDLG